MEKLIDARAKITPLANAVIEAHHRSDGRDHSEIIRDVLQEWALREASKASLVSELAAREGFTGESQGSPGNRRESQGFSGNARE